ncbi:hypothetical protein [Providencia burhodogranariea]|uniref:hypothetical protein n=1 Tax=Providencia burhodogranariea TaxID=516074 RepID=UPI00030373C4|nr:hypothetical protein [Providencia burhodogranariea]
MAYVSVLEVVNSSGNSFNIISSEPPEQDTGACDPQNGQSLLSEDNNSIITIH